MRRKYKIIFVAQDIGGFNALLPVIKKLKKKKKFLLKTILSDQARNTAKKNRINCQDGQKLTNKELAQLLKKECPDLIFTATSIGESIEKRITKITKAQKMKTIALIDFWANYKPRFSSLPDYILVIDRIMKKEMIENGFDPRKLIIVGSPVFDNFSRLFAVQKEEIISFFSQPLSELPKKRGKVYWGYDEIQVFEDLVDCLEKLQFKIPIKVKFHPRTKKLDKFDKIIKNSKLRISIERKLSAEGLIKRSKIVIGIGSVVLFQAALAGKDVLSYQPNLKRRDPLVSNRLGISTAVYKKKNLYPVLKKMISARPQKKNLKVIERYTQNKSTQKVINFIQEVINERR